MKTGEEKILTSRYTRGSGSEIELRLGQTFTQHSWIGETAVNYLKQFKHAQSWFET